MSKNNNNELDGAKNHNNESFNDFINNIDVGAANITTLTSTTITNGIGESIVLNSDNIEFKTSDTTKVTVGTNTTLTNNLVLPTAGSITNGSNESITFSADDINLKTNNVARLTAKDDGVDVTGVLTTTGTLTIPDIVLSGGDNSISSGNESIILESDRINFSVDGSIRATFKSTGISTNYDIELPTTGAIKNNTAGDQESIVFSSSDIQLKTSGTTRATLTDGNLTLGVGFVQSTAGYSSSTLATTDSSGGAATHVRQAMRSHSTRGAAILFTNNDNATNFLFGKAYVGGSAITKLALAYSAASDLAASTITGQIQEWYNDLSTRIFGKLIVPAGSASAPTWSVTGDSDTGIYSSAADNIDFSTNSTRRMNISNTRVNFAQGYSIGAGAICGVYNDTTFTPTFTGASAGAAPTYQTQTGRYTQLGNMVCGHMELAWSAVGGSTGEFRVSLPVSGAVYGSFTITDTNNIDFASGYLVGQCDNTNYATFRAIRNGTVSLTINIADLLASNGFINITFMYFLN
jgi:hypothetical protein